MTVQHLETALSVLPICIRATLLVDAHLCVRTSAEAPDVTAAIGDSDPGLLAHLSAYTAPCRKTR